MNIDRYHYHLPEELIAQYPLERGSERLLVLERKTGKISHRRFPDLDEYLRKDDLLVLNDTRVIHARLLGRKESGGRVEVLLLRENVPGQWSCLVKASKTPRQGMKLFFDEVLS
ncbi:tRNA preQ1(34) S-adenosylmethionine ribosyltransferase-isomerase QueA, partial [archaeon]|nr:tRNA preQ1(34) S-adenosylmethionine ribosyltransferase-isomerase QueA [archaeon]